MRIRNPVRFKKILKICDFRFQRHMGCAYGMRRSVNATKYNMPEVILAD